MASIVLGTAGAALGGTVPVGGTVLGASLGRRIGSTLGGVLDNAISGRRERFREGARLSDLSVQVSSYGKVIPIVYGTMRLAGNVIWSLPIRETATTSTSTSGGGKGVAGGGGTRTTRTTYSYSVSLAIALCEGEVQSVLRIWADAALLDLSQLTYRIYTGSDDQLPDPLIEGAQGIGNTPAYRGLAYVVIEDFPLEAYGNRIPNFTFEVKRPARTPDYNGQSVEEMITGMTLIPGAGEFVYDTVPQIKIQGQQVGVGFAQSQFQTSINRHTPYSEANVTVALDQLAETCPNLEWVSVVITWFGDSLDAASCTIQPGVEFTTGAMTAPDSWSVAGLSRAGARQITLVDGTPRYGGTPSDASVLRLIDALKARGYSVMVYPMFFMDVEGKPWRGRITGAPADVASFFTRANGLNAFVMHYANLVAGRADAFVIGSELIGLTKVSDAPGSYPAVSALVSLAASVRAVMGAGTMLTYAADWSEYHHTDGGWYNLDPLWASPDIDVIGIDAYFPLTDAPQTTLGYALQPVLDGWDSGEGYDFYYSDVQRSVQAPLAPPYAWKNLDWFWRNTHTNPGGGVTPWVPESKPVWFTEFGFPSVDGATNQPNVFYDPASVESFFPYHSRGSIDIRAQRLGITATLARWQGSGVVDESFLWTWDARPFPYFPDLETVWADGASWAPGHWVTGKFGVSGLAAIVRDLCIRSGLSDAQIDVSALTDPVEGYVLNRRGEAAAFLEELMDAYAFDAVASGGVLRFVPRGQPEVASIEAEVLLREPDEDTALVSARASEASLPSVMEILYMDRIRNYEAGTQRATRQSAPSTRREALTLPLVLPGAQAQAIAQRLLYTRWQERSRLRFRLPPAYSALEVTDVLVLEAGNTSQRLRITALAHAGGALEVEAVAEDVALYTPGTFTDDAPSATRAVPLQPASALELLDLPAFPQDAAGEARLRLAAVGLAEGWEGAAIYREEAGSGFTRLMDLAQPAVMGTVSVVPGDYRANRLDEVNTLDVVLLGGGELHSVSQRELLDGANVALAGEEVLQFRSAVALGGGAYRLSGLLRGRLGTEHATTSHSVGERFVLLDGALGSVAMPSALFGLVRNYKAVSFGATLASAPAQAFAYNARALMPYAPVHVRAEGGIGSDITLNWVRRDRLYGAWRDGVDAGLSEAVEAYDVVISIDGTPARTLQVSTPLATYTAAQQALDGLSGGEALRFDVYQRSGIVGRGVGVSVMII